MKQQRFDVFISYRRKGGDATARLFYERLTAMGYRVSYDIETLRGGKFEDYRAKAGRVYTIYRRQADGAFQKLVSKMPEGQPRATLVNLKEAF